MSTDVSGEQDRDSADLARFGYRQELKRSLGVPILWTVMIFIVLIGAVYHLAAGRKKRLAPVVAPSEDDAPLAGSGAA